MKTKAKRELDLRLVDAALEREGLTIVGSPEERVERLRAHYEALPAVQLSDCSECGFASPAEDPACAFCGHVDAEGSTAIVEAPPEVLADAKEAERELDEAIGQYVAAGQNMVGAGWDMGIQAKRILDKRLYLARRDGKGAPVHRTFKDFCRVELSRSDNYVRELIDVASNFSREEAIRIGTSKLGVTLRVFDAKKRAPLLEMAKDPDVSLRQLREATNEVVRAQPRRLDRNGQLRGRPRKLPPPVFPPVSPFLGQKAEEEPEGEKERPRRRLTISVEEGEHQVKLWAKRRTPEDRRRARELADGPVGRLRCPNGTQIRFRILRSENGLYMKVEFTEAGED